MIIITLYCCPADVALLSYTTLILRMLDTPKEADVPTSHLTRARLNTGRSEEPAKILVVAPTGRFRTRWIVAFSGK